MNGQNRTQTWEELAKAGFSIIPLNGKAPIEKGWQQYCEKRRPWNPEDFRGRNAGIACGPASGMIALDIDDVVKFRLYAHGKELDFNKTRVHRTGSGKLHILYQYPADGKRYGNRVIKEHGFDIRGAGGQIVAPGSIHPETHEPYRVIRNNPIQPAPDWLLELCRVDDPAIPKRGNIEAMTAPDIETLPIRQEMTELIRHGEEKGRRSEAIMKVVTALVGARVPDQEIFAVFDTFPIGGKYREKGPSKARWLQGRIAKAKQWIAAAENPPTSAKEEMETIKFPHEVMAGAAGEFAEAYSSILEVPKHFFYIAYLTCLGSVLSDKITVSSEITPQPRLYVVLLGQSANDRKSTALNKTISFFREALPEFSVCEGVGSAEGLQRQLKGKPKLLLCFDEFRQLVSKCEIESSVLLPCINTLFESNSYENQTKSGGIKVTGAHVSILAASTVETWERTWNASFTDIGFNNRLFIVPGTAERKYPIPPRIQQEVTALLKKNLDSILDRLTQDILKLGLTPEAKEAFDSWYMGLDSSVHAKRLDAYALRFMSLLAVNEAKECIDLDIVQKVTMLCDWQLQVRKLYDPINADNKIAAMEENIRRALSTGPKTERELKQRTNANRAGLWVFKTARSNLESAKEIARDRKDKKWKLCQSEV